MVRLVQLVWQHPGPGQAGIYIGLGATTASGR